MRRGVGAAIVVSFAGGFLVGDLLLGGSFTVSVPVVALLLSAGLILTGLGLLAVAVVWARRDRSTLMRATRRPLYAPPAPTDCKHPGVPGGEHSSMWPGFRAPPADW